MADDMKRPQITAEQRENVREAASDYLPVDADGMSFSKQLEIVLAHLDELKETDANTRTVENTDQTVVAPDGFNNQL